MENRQFGGERRNFAPVNVGDEIEVKIEAVGEKGDGVAKVKGFVLFVPNAKKDMTYKVRVTRVLRKVGFAEIVGEGTEKAEGSEEQPSEESKEYSENSTEETAEDTTEETTEDAEGDSEEF